MNKYKIVSVIIIAVIFVVVGIIAGKIHREDNLIASGEALVVSEPAVDQEALQVISFYPATPFALLMKIGRWINTLEPMSIERMSFGNKANNKISFLVALMAIFIMFGIFGIMGGVVTNADINEKLNRYETAKAKIVDYRVETKYARKLGTTRHYYPIYSYKVDGKTYEYESKASSTSKKTGTTIIYYDPKKPYKVITVEEKYTGVVLIVAGSVFLFIGIITLMSISIVFKKKRLNQRP